MTHIKEQSKRERDLKESDNVHTHTSTRSLNVVNQEPVTNVGSNRSYSHAKKLGDFRVFKTAQVEVSIIYLES